MSAHYEPDIELSKYDLLFTLEQLYDKLIDKGLDYRWSDDKDCISFSNPEYGSATIRKDLKYTNFDFYLKDIISVLSLVKDENNLVRSTIAYINKIIAPIIIPRKIISKGSFEKITTLSYNEVLDKVLEYARLGLKVLGKEWEIEVTKETSENYHDKTIEVLEIIIDTPACPEEIKVTLCYDDAWPRHLYWIEEFFMSIVEHIKNSTHAENFLNEVRCTLPLDGLWNTDRPVILKAFSVLVDNFNKYSKGKQARICLEDGSKNYAVEFMDEDEELIKAFEFYSEKVRFNDAKHLIKMCKFIYENTNKKYPKTEIFKAIKDLLDNADYLRLLIENELEKS